MAATSRWSGARCGGSTRRPARTAISPDLPRFLTEDEAGYIPRDRIVLICTGSQGEPRAALSRIARDDHPQRRARDRAMSSIFSSRIIPGNEKAINRLQNALVRLGVEIVTEEDHFVHVSGHPARDELVRMYQMVRPQIAVPVHGEARHLIAPCRARAAMPGSAAARHRERRHGPARGERRQRRRRGAGRPHRQRRQGSTAARRRGAEGASSRHLQRQRRCHLGPRPPRRASGTADDQPDRRRRTGRCRGGGSRLARRRRTRDRRAAGGACAATTKRCATRRAERCAASSTNASASGRWSKSIWSGFEHAVHDACGRFRCE